MSKIEIHNIQELIKQGYPHEVIKSLLNQVLELSLLVKQDYPDYKNWYTNTQIPGIYDNTRNIIIAHINDRIVGFVSLKKTSAEKKICTFYVEKNFRKNKIGTILVEKAIEYLEESQPLITIPMDKLNDFIKISNRYNWQVTDIKENLYRATTPEVIVNGRKEIEVQKIEIPKQISKVYRIYKIEVLKNFLKISITNPLIR